MENVPVSVVIPAYNRAELLDAALASVREQTVEPAEILVVDDGSDNDDVGAVARRYEARVLRKENGGVSSARNAGLAAARARWVAFLDADDLWLPRKLELQYGALKRTNGYGAVISNFRIFTSLGSFDETAFELNSAYRSIDKRPIDRDAYELSMTSAGAALARSMFAQPSCLLVDRDLALGIGGFDTRLRRCEDHEFALRVFAATRVLSIDNAVVRYRVAPESLSKNEIAMRLGSLEVAAYVLAEPERYPPGAADIIKRLRPALVRKAAASYMKKGDFAAARALLRPLMRDRPDRMTIAMYFASVVAWGGVRTRDAEFFLKVWRRRPWRKARDWHAASPASRALLSAADLVE